MLKPLMDRRFIYSLNRWKNDLIKTQAYINGQWVNGIKGKTFDVSNPATGELIAAIPDMSREDVRMAIDTANDAWPAYRELTAGQRATLLKKWYA
ncbi:MAG: aldehyde dehydrogenase family protein, partial [Chitinophagaceae bacterium]